MVISSPSLFKLLDFMNNIQLPSRSKNDIRINLKTCFINCSLYITACGNYNCPGIHFSCPVNHLAALSVRNIGDRARIDHIDICRLGERHNLKPRFLQQCCH